jgi:uncharacterized damage-inducible protein DinB
MPKVEVLPSQYYALLQTLQAAPSRAAALLALLPPEAHTWSPPPNEWTASEIITHLAAADGLFAGRLKRLATDANPTVPDFGPAEAPPDGAARAAEALVRFATSRQALLDVLLPLPPAAWARPGLHTRTGPTTLARQVQVIVQHDHEHFGQLAALRAAWEHRPGA